MKKSKVIIALEIMKVMEFLNIPFEKFSELKNQYGGLIQLHLEMENRILGN